VARTPSFFLPNAVLLQIDFAADILLLESSPEAWLKIYPALQPFDET